MARVRDRLLFPLSSASCETSFQSCRTRFERKEAGNEGESYNGTPRQISVDFAPLPIEYSNVYEIDERARFGDVVCRRKAPSRGGALLTHLYEWTAIPQMTHTSCWLAVSAYLHRTGCRREVRSNTCIYLTEDICFPSSFCLARRLACQSALSNLC